jgi:hypothetical protein
MAARQVSWFCAGSAALPPQARRGHGPINAKQFSFVMAAPAGVLVLRGRWVLKESLLDPALADPAVTNGVHGLSAVRAP